MPFQYLKKEVSNKVDLLHADKHQSFLEHFLQRDTITIDGHDQSFSKYSK